MNSSVSFQSVSSHGRMQLLDVLRGFASFGILLVNIHSFSDVGWLTPEQKSSMATYPVDNVVKTILDIFIDTKFITLFTILFGVGFAIQLERAKAAGINFKAYFAKRMAILLTIACLHAYLLWFGDIIRYYAIAGFFLLLIMNWSVKAILRIAVFFAVFVTASVFILNSIIGIHYHANYPALQQIHDAFAYGSYSEVLKINWLIDPVHNFFQDSLITTAAVFGRVLLGYWLGRIYFFQKPKTFLNMRAKWIWWGLCLGFPCSVAFWAIKAGHLSLDSYWLLWLPYVIVCGLILQSLFYIAIVMKLFEKKKWKKRLLPFGWVGRMALSNYLLQSVFGIIIFYGWFPGLRLKGIGATYLLVISVFVFILQVLISRWWLQHHSMGPVEWLWKKLAYPKKSLVKKFHPPQIVETI
ncbi:MAG TPA: DUF418 domain-containing protein [Chitinophagaceae bacterium]|nr:DUF418 domain-containing protein [Chitinophagaceae bacterium]